MNHVSTLTSPPVIGKHYVVPCVLSRISLPSGGKLEAMVPIYGPLHDDAEIIGFDYTHWHVDWRFVSQRSVVAWEFDDGRDLPAIVICICENCRPFAAIGTPEDRRRVCQRTMPAFPTIISKRLGKPPIPWMRELEDAYAGKRACGTCPHRGFRLTGLAVRKGLVVCTGHGLQWNVKTGELVRRTM